MPSLGSVLSIASTALKVHRESLNVLGHNVANAQTEGYTRQRLVSTANKPLSNHEGLFGTGIRSVNVEQIRDRFVDAQLRRSMSSFSHADARQGALHQVQTAFNEPSELGVSSQLDRFFSAFSDLATDPTSRTARNVVLAEASELAGRLNRLSNEMDRLRVDSETRANAQLSRMNDLLSQIAELNREITSSEAGERTAGDLRDRRNLAIDELADLVPVTVIDQPTGGVAILAEGVLLLDGAQTNQLEIRDNAGTLELGLLGRVTTVDPSRGRVGGELHFQNMDLPDLRADLDALAAELVTSVNAIHRTGTSPDGSTGLDFFDPAGATASSIRLAAAMTGPERVSAGVASGLGNYQGGDTSVALALAGLRDTTAAALGDTPGGFFRGLVSEVGRLVRFAEDESSVQGALVGQAEATRLSISGVSIDEELVEMIQLQTAFGAAARVIGVADEMMETLVNL